MNNKDELIKLLKEYIELLAQDIRSNTAFLHVHGIHTPKEVIEKGVELRNKIKELENNES